MHLVRRAGLVALGIVAAAVITATAGWALDGRGHAGRVGRSVSVAGEDVGGLSSAELSRVVDRLARRATRAAVSEPSPRP